MSPDVRHADTVFAQAIEIESPEERSVFLDKACASDPELRREVEKLVRDYFRAGSGAVTSRLTPRPMGQPRVVEGALSDA